MTEPPELSVFSCSVAQTIALRLVVKPDFDFCFNDSCSRHEIRACYLLPRLVMLANF